MEAKKRDEVIDIMKGLAIIFVIYGHSHFIPIIGKWIYTFHMPLFFFISGCLFKSNYDFKKNLKRIILPYISFAVIMCFTTLFVSCCLAIINNLDITRILNSKLIELKINLFNAVNGDERSFFFKTIWFLPVLFIVEYLYFILQKTLASKIHFVCSFFFAISIFLYYYKINLPYFIDTILLIIPYYHCGKIFYNNRNYFTRINILYVYVMIILPIIIVLLKDYNVDYKYNIVPWYNHILSLMTIIGAYLLLNIIQIRMNFIKSLGQLSIFYFGLHRSFFMIYLPIISKLNFNIYLQSIILCILSIFSIYFLLSVLGKRKNLILLNI